MALPLVALMALVALWLACDRDATQLLRSPFGWRAHARSRTTPNGGVILGWERARQATSYEVHFLGPGRRELDAVGGVETLELVLTREALPRYLVPGSEVTWSVVALAGNREIGHSPPQPLRLP